jgi:hypothetical protein
MAVITYFILLEQGAGKIEAFEISCGNVYVT